MSHSWNQNDPQPRDEKWARLHDVMDLVCSSEDKSGQDMDELALRAREILVGKGKHMEEASFQYLEDCFNSCEEFLNTEDNGKEFELIQAFIRAEQDLGRQRRKASRMVEATEEKRLAAEIAELKGFRSRTHILSSHDDLQQKIADAERSYFNRKMVVAKAAQVANAECRLQFGRVREFFDSLHNSRRETLRRQYKRSLNLQSVTHRLRNTDPRVAALERQIINRLYHKKKTDLNELHMTQNMEEATYLEAMIDLLFKVQTGKETAARELFELHVQYLKEERASNMRRFEELSGFRANATKDMAKVIAHYTEEEDDNNEAEEEVRENVDAMERRKDHNASIPIMSVTQLYDAVLWSVAATTFSTTGSSSLCSSDFGSDQDYGAEDVDEDDEEQPEVEANSELQDPDLLEDNNDGWAKENENEGHMFSDTASTQASTCDGSVVSAKNGEEKSRLSSLGKIHVKQLSRELRKQEKELIKKHEAEAKIERHRYKAAARALRKKHQKVVDGLLQKCLYERHNLREGIAHRMRAMESKMLESTKTLRKIIEEDIKVMQEALRAEDQRLEDTEKNSFIKAQELVSSQVFHEVRNALSSMISMSEITSSLKHDESLSPTDLVNSVDDMLDQIKEVVQYSLNMLNNILDVSKIKSGSFVLDCKSFDLQELVSGATRMQLAKAGQVKMSFVPNPAPCVVFTDKDLVIRIVTNFISNAIKFTGAGAIQPFVWPVEDMFGTEAQFSCDSSIASNEADDNDRLPDKHFLNTNRLLQSELSQLSDDIVDVTFTNQDITNEPVDVDEEDIPLFSGKRKLYAVGVADSGVGLQKEMLRSSETALSSANSVSGSMVACVRNSGFGLHLAHLLAKALGTKLRLTSLDQCCHLLNDDMLRAVEEYRQLELVEETKSNLDLDGAESVGGRSLKGASSPGSGTVIYITLPVYEDQPNDAESGLEVDSHKHVSSTGLPTEPPEKRKYPSGTEAKDSWYTFCPKTSENAADRTFRILVADDVLMLRKGLVHGITRLFQIPVSICTACTAEDVLRATSSEPFDLVICDNQFLHEGTSMINPLSKDDESKYGRPRLVYDKSKVSSSELNRKMKEFFENEKFIVKDGDGALSGFEALKKISQAKHPAFPTPVLILLSGHKWDKPPCPGIILIQKPLNQSAFVPILEAHAKELLDTGFCIEKNDDTGIPRLLNRHGSQLFVPR